MSRFEVTERGIEKVIKEDDSNGYVTKTVETIIPKEIFIQAYHEYIEKEKK